ncbi:MAG: hypothetical protein LBF51_05250 [Zoogloeaceae bacterium]|nr:hypothetical protein [Zoogloeaceae bacterium]
MTIPTPDPMEFVRQMWGKLGFTMPGMVTPTFNQPDLEKNIADLRAVEGWLRTNLSMLQMTIQGLEMQKTTLSTVEAVGKIMRQPEGKNAAGTSGAANAPQASIGETLQRATLWPFSMMQQVQEGLQKHLEGEVKAAADRARAATAAATAASAPEMPAAKPAAKKAAAKPAAKKA